MVETTVLYGVPPAGLMEIPAGGAQVSPLIPGSQDLAELADASVDRALVLAPGGALERTYVLAQALRVLKPGGRLLAFAPKDKGGSRLKKTLEGLGCTVVEDARRHHRFCQAERPARPTGLAEALAGGAPRVVAELGVWSQPGVFSWDRLDPGSARLIDLLPQLQGRGADLGCGVGLLAQRVLASAAVKGLDAVDIDRRAIACAERNLDDPRVRLAWLDARSLETSVPLDFVVMNPPFHDAGREDRDLGVAFIATASRLLRKGGVCWLVANRHLPYEAALSKAFSHFDVRGDGGGYKVIEARR
jgi:16S rRNA (guanine1207-N2)-methyltransferase